MALMWDGYLDCRMWGAIEERMLLLGYKDQFGMTSKLDSSHDSETVTNYSEETELRHESHARLFDCGTILRRLVQETSHLLSKQW